MIKDIIKLATIVMVIDNESDQNEIELFQKIPLMMAAHLEDRAGVNIMLKSGKSSKVVKNKKEMDEESEHNLEMANVAEIANATITEFNTIDQSDNEKWLTKVAENIKGRWIRFHTLKLLVDMAAADGEVQKEEVEVITPAAICWGLEEDLADFLFLKTRTEWVWDSSKRIIKDTKKKTKYY